MRDGSRRNAEYHAITPLDNPSRFHSRLVVGNDTVTLRNICSAIAASSRITAGNAIVQHQRKSASSSSILRAGPPLCSRGRKCPSSLKRFTQRNSVRGLARAAKQLSTTTFPSNAASASIAEMR